MVKVPKITSQTVLVLFVSVSVLQDTYSYYDTLDEI